MSDALPPSEPPAPSPASVVIDEHAEVKVKRWPIWVALGAVLAFLAFTAIWYVVEDDGEYEPGAPAQAFLAEIDGNDFDLEPTDAELACIDRAGKGVDMEIFESETFDPLNLSVDAEAFEFVIEVFDECLERETRIDMLAQSLMLEDPSVGEADAVCVGEGMDDVIIDSGGWGTVITDSDEVNPVFLAIFSVMEECGVELF